MRKVLSRSLLTAAATTGVLAAAAGYAQADAGAGSSNSGSPGLLSGNTLEAPVDTPVNACGNTADVVGLLNPVFGNTCVTDADQGRGPRQQSPQQPDAEQPQQQPPGEQDSSRHTGRQQEKPVEQSSVPAPAAEPAAAPAGSPARGQAAAPVAETSSPGVTEQMLAETGSAGTGTAAAVGFGVLVGGVVLYRRASRRRGC